VAALRTAGGLVREYAASSEAVARDVVGHGLQRARVEHAGDAVGAVAAAVQQRVQLHPADRTVFLHAGTDTHLHGVPAAVALEDLLAVEADLDRPAQLERRLADDDLVVEDVALSAEAAAVGTGDHADVGRRDLQHLGQRAVHVVRGLRAGPERQFAVAVDAADRGVLLDREVGVALEEKGVVEDLVSILQGLVHVAEVEAGALVDVTLLAVLVDPWLGVPQRLLRGGDRAKRFVVDLDQLDRLAGRLLVPGDHRGDGVTDVAHLFAAERLLVLADGQDAELDRQVLTGQHEVHARVLFGARDVESDDSRVGQGRAKEPAVQHARQHQVVGEDRLPGHLGAAVHAAARLADDVELASAVAHRFASFLPICSTASSTDSKICR